MVDALGNPVGFHQTGGEAHDLVGADQLLPNMQADTLIADKAFDADKRVIEPLAAAGKATVIPPKANRRSPRSFDRELYKERHLIENFFARLEQFRAIATRYDKTARNFLAAVHLRPAAAHLGRRVQYGRRGLLPDHHVPRGSRGGRKRRQERGPQTAGFCLRHRRGRCRDGAGGLVSTQYHR
jgi:transposase